MRITVNPDAQASAEFGYAAPGEYTLRIKKVEQLQKQGSEWAYLKWTFEFADPNVKAVEEGKSVGNIFENTSLKPDAQFRLRDLCEALGLTWGDFDTDQTVGQEVTVRLGTEMYQNKLSNKVESFVK